MTKITFEEEVKDRLDEAKGKALLGIDKDVRDAVSTVIQHAFGMQQDRWSGNWAVDVNRHRFAEDTEIAKEVNSRVASVLPGIVDEVLSEPVVFSAKDVKALRMSFKHMLLKAAEDALEQRASDSAAKVIADWHDSDESED